MDLALTPKQLFQRDEFRQFSTEEIAPDANRFDEEERLPPELFQKLRAKGLLGTIIQQEMGGRGLDMVTYGLLNEEIGRCCSSVRSLLTVHDMVSHTIVRWGLASQKKKWIPLLATGEIIGALAVSEPTTGSDLNNVQTTAISANGSYVLKGTKKWVSFGQIAGLFLVLARCEGKLTAFLVERDRPGVSIEPISGMLGVRASMLAQVKFDNCEIPSSNLIGGIGWGLHSAISTALSLGRYAVAWGCVGIGQGCVDASLVYANERKQFGAYLKQHQLIKQMIAEMFTNVSAARLLCFQAGQMKDQADPHELMQTFVAKYFASKTAISAATDAVQIHGANGCSSNFPVQRYFRDAKIMEIIEGSNQMQQLTIADYAYQQWNGVEPLRAGSIKS